MTDATYKHGEFCWNELGTRDMEKVKPFYQALAGWGHRDDPMPWEGDDPSFYTTWKSDAGQFGGGYVMGEHHEGMPSHWLSYVHVDDVDATAAKAKELGGSLLAEPMDVPGVCRMAIVQDPHGATFGIFQPAGHPGATKMGPKPGTFSWFEVMTPDAEAAKGFYSKLFGWNHETQNMGDFDYTTFALGKWGVAGMMQMDGPQWEGIPPHWMPYITVADTDAAVEAAKAHGGEVSVEPTDVPGVGRFAVLRDPGGAHVSVIAYDESVLNAGEGEPAAEAAAG